MVTTTSSIHSVGQGPGVVLLHSSGSSARQWAPLAEELQTEFRVHAVDFHGHGTAPAWNGAAPLTLDDDAALVEPLLNASADGVHLVGHSYGGAVALKLALKHPARVRSVTVYEPVVFRVLFDFNLLHAPAQRVLATAGAVHARLRRGMNEDAARVSVDFWSGAGSWDRTPVVRQQSVAARMPSVMAHFNALFFDGMQRRHLAALQVPTLFLTGAATIAPTRRIGELLRHAVPFAQHEMLDDMGHLGPVTHAAIVNERIVRFLRGQVSAQVALEQLREAA